MSYNASQDQNAPQQDCLLLASHEPIPYKQASLNLSTMLH